MPGRFYLTAPQAEVSAFARADLPPLAPRLNIAPGEEALALTAGGPTTMRWGMIPVGRTNARGRPVMDTLVNARSETVFDKSAFAGVQRAVVPMNGWYEWTGEAKRKTVWRLRPKSGDVVGFASVFDIWNGPGGVKVPQFATLTCAPNTDVRDIHHRIGVILMADQVQDWLSGDEETARALMRPLPDGLLKIEKADDVDLAYVGH
ncbi:SOS response-associated peptidase [Pseudooctadecabacter jejudonensis]|uniref:Abasic site processing protein n=1 Tax=Pseudooctadecabacter jejudonensis TaxID=1391910 RepID=A0A1Y5SRF5_9RHOB|nr:SOS response-associated peptidase [Pseudooctadecabacter jejudonensis]SLN46713.1 hypothetical protein PSJ8397_02440 [Pseudooctadecabacter jejudonensis]